MQKYDKGEMAEIVLGVLLVAGIVVVATTMPNAVQLFKYFKPKTAADRSRIKRSVFRLEKSGLIERKNGDDELFVLTQKGKERAMRYELDRMKIAPQKIWDKKWRLIMFDIPEGKKQARRAINFALKKLGCAQYQKSVFITPFPCKKEIDFVGECFGARENISIITADEVERSESIKKAFKVS